MLEKCQAYLVAKNRADIAVLRSVAQGAGFQSTIDAATGEGETNPAARVKFFFVDSRVDDNEVLSTMAAVRASTDQDLRFSPFILVIDQSPDPATLKKMDFGFDEVIYLPEEPDVTRSRLMGQLFLEQTYFETATYLGPDRRRVEIKPDIGERRDPARIKHYRYLIRRDPDQGVRIIERVLAA